MTYSGLGRRHGRGFIRNLGRAFLGAPGYLKKTSDNIGLTPAINYVVQRGLPIAEKVITKKLGGRRRRVRRMKRRVGGRRRRVVRRRKHGGRRRHVRRVRRGGSALSRLRALLYVPRRQIAVPRLRRCGVKACHNIGGRRVKMLAGYGVMRRSELSFPKMALMRKVGGRIIRTKRGVAKSKKIIKASLKRLIRRYKVTRGKGKARIGRRIKKLRIMLRGRGFLGDFVKGFKKGFSTVMNPAISIGTSLLTKRLGGRRKRRVRRMRR